MLPQSLIDRVGLARDVTLIGNLNLIEIWGREQWSKRQPELDAQADRDRQAPVEARPRGAVAVRDTCS